MGVFGLKITEISMTSSSGTAPTRVPTGRLSLPESETFLLAIGPSSPRLGLFQYSRTVPGCLRALVQFRTISRFSAGRRANWYDVRSIRTMVVARLARRTRRMGGIMAFKNSKTTLLAGVCAAALCALAALEAQQAPAVPGGRGGGGGGPAANVFTAADVNRDGFVTRDELKAAFAKWLADGDTGRTGSVTQEQLAAALNAAFPQPPGRQPRRHYCGCARDFSNCFRPLFAA